MDSAEPSPNVSKLPLLIMGAVVMVVVLITIALAADRGPKAYPPGTPEAAVQEFIQVAFDDDMPILLLMLTEESRARCEAKDPWFDDNIYSDGLRAELQEMDVTGDTATAEVRFRRSGSNDPFDNSTWSRDERFELIRVEGTWLIDQASWPHQIADCTNRRR